MKVKLKPETKPYSDWRGELAPAISQFFETVPILVRSHVYSNGCVLVSGLTIHGQHIDWFYINPIHLEVI